MKKFLLLGFLSMFGASQANAGFIQTVTGADMAGMQVTVNYLGGFSETLTWEVTSVGNGLTDNASLETAIGGVTGTGFSLSQQGDSQGNVDNNGTTDLSDDTFFGLWTFKNTSQDMITSLFINTQTTNVLFDTMFDDINGNGSGVGRGFTTNISGPVAVSSDLYMDELYRGLTVNFNLESGDTLIFMADTDLVTVSAPATASILMFSLLGLVMNARRKQA